MTGGPNAEVGQIVELPFERPRRRAAVLEHARCYELRETSIAFLEAQAPERAGRQEPPRATRAA